MTVSSPRRSEYYQCSPDVMLSPLLHIATKQYFKDRTSVLVDQKVLLSLVWSPLTLKML